MTNSKTHTDEWDTVQDETPPRVVFDTIGDQFIGAYVGIDDIVPEKGDPFTMYLFRAQGNKSVEDGTLCAINSSYTIRRGMEKIQPGQVVRITYVKTVEVGRPEPMKDFRIDTKR